MLKRILFLTVVLLIGATQAYGSSSSHILGKNMNDWRAEGKSYVTDSPIYPTTGVRLSTCSDGVGDGYKHAIAYSEYHVLVSTWGRSMLINIAYNGNDGGNGDGIAGRLWIQYASSNEGDSFNLRQNQRSQSIRLPTWNYSNNGWMTIRIVAEGSQEIDVNFINVNFYIAAHKIRIRTRHRTNYDWRPWYHYTYRYFYPGKHIYWDSRWGCWVRYTYSRHSHYWAPRYNRYNAYMSGYNQGRRDERVRTGGRGHIGKWSNKRTRDRNVYVTSRRSRSFAVPRGDTRNVLTVLTQQDRSKKAPGPKGGQIATVKRRVTGFSSPTSQESVQNNPKTRWSRRISADSGYEDTIPQGEMDVMRNIKARVRTRNNSAEVETRSSGRRGPSSQIAPGSDVKTRIKGTWTRTQVVSSTGVRVDKQRSRSSVVRDKQRKEQQRRQPEQTSQVKPIRKPERVQRKKRVISERRAEVKDKDKDKKDGSAKRRFANSGRGSGR